MYLVVCLVNIYINLTKRNMHTNKNYLFIVR
jgi:hypothetical protein